MSEQGHLRGALDQILHDPYPTVWQRMRHSHTPMPWTYRDRGWHIPEDVRPGDCVARAISLATGLDYRDTCALIDSYAQRERPTRKTRHLRSTSHAGVFRKTYDRVLADLGWVWTPTMHVGRGCRMHLCQEEFPQQGVYIARLSRHLAVVIDGVVQDTGDPSRNGTRCVYGYWNKP